MRKLAIASLLIVAALSAAAYSETEDATASKRASSKAAAKEAPEAADRPSAPAKGDAASEDPEKINWKKVDWRKRLSKLQYYVMRRAGTEPPFKNEYWDHFEDGSYKCAGCGLPLFESTSKFDSECGWPSFDKTVAKDSVTEHLDRKMYVPRTEIRCRRCGAHLGHVFNDGPTATGLRYCMNSAAMKFVAAKGAVAKDKTASPKDEDAAAPAPARDSEAAGAEK
jgi:peptide-methionine (R)-S-oxide reductase